MLLCNVTIYGNAERKNILISDGVIKSITDEGRPLPENKDGKAFHLNGAVVFPGFINSHDHLDFNLYPQLGRSPYHNYTEWGHDIHQAYTGEIAAVKKIPEPLRVQWGLYKNLLNGFTTVVNHGKKINVRDDIITVFQDCISLHSVSFEKNWQWKLNNPFYRIKPYVIHAGEGVDEKSGNEIDRIVQTNYLGKKIIAVHGVAMNGRQAGSFAGLVWCPASNYFMFGKTADAGLLKKNTTLVFGTDSTLTSPWQIQEHFRLALCSGAVTENELLDMLTTVPAGLWGFNDRGKIESGMRADLLIAETGSSLISAGPGTIKMVLVNGKIRLLTEEQAVQHRTDTGPFDNISISGISFFITKGIKQLLKNIRAVSPGIELPSCINDYE